MSQDELRAYNKIQRFLIRRFIACGKGDVNDWIKMNAMRFRIRWEQKHAA